MKPFDLELAKAGHPVQTRDGRAVRIICWDAKGLHPVVGLVLLKDGQEQTYAWTKRGVYSISETNDLDLFMSSTKKSGWVNLFMDAHGNPYTGSKIYTTEADARRVSEQAATYLCTTRIEWEE